MKITVQQGIDASQLQDAMYALVVAGMECDAHAARLRYQARLKLMAPQMELQPSLFEGEV